MVVLTDHPKMVAETFLHLAKVPCQPCNLSIFQNGERYNSNNAHFGEAVKHQLDMESLFYQPLAVVFREFLVLQAFNKSPVCFERIPLNNSKMSILKEFYEASNGFFGISSNKISVTTWAMDSHQLVHGPYPTSRPKVWSGPSFQRTCP